MAVTAVAPFLSDLDASHRCGAAAGDGLGLGGVAGAAGTSM